MKKKGFLIGGVLLVLILCLGAYYVWQKDQHDVKNANHAEITVTIIDASTKDEFELYKGTTITEKTTLAEYLLELQEEKIISLESNNGQYGMYITGMGGANIVRESTSENKYWVFDSENNADCLKADYCPAADQVYLSDQDTFTFRLEKMGN